MTNTSLWLRYLHADNLLAANTRKMSSFDK